MALRDQPYLPLYVQDFLTDERLSECCAESHGVYIRLMCLMHKSNEYGTITLRPKDKRSGDPIKDFTAKLTRQMPFTSGEVERSLRELVDEGVLTLDGDRLFQCRMVRDAKLSAIRASAGRKGGSSNKSASTSNEFAYDFALANSQAKHRANAESENEKENESNNIQALNTPEGINITPAPAREGDSLFAKVMSYYMDRVNPMPSSMVVSELQDFCTRLPADLIIRAIDITLDAKATSWKYTRAILARWEREGITSLAMLAARENRRGPPGTDGSDQTSNPFLKAVLEGRYDDE